MPTISYSYTDYRSNKNFADPLPLEEFEAIKGDRTSFEMSVDRVLKDEFHNNRDRHRISSFLYKTSMVLVVIGGLLAIGYLGGGDSMDSSVREKLESSMMGVYLALSLSMIGSLSYWRSRRQYRIATRSLNRYYSLHMDLVSQSPDYEAYLTAVEGKREYFEIIGRQRNFYESQKL